MRMAADCLPRRNDEMFIDDNVNEKTKWRRRGAGKRRGRCQGVSLRRSIGMCQHYHRPAVPSRPGTSPRKTRRRIRRSRRTTRSTWRRGRSAARPIRPWRPIGQAARCKPPFPMLPGATRRPLPHTTRSTSAAGPRPDNASGSLTCTLNAIGGSWGSQYDFTVTATATAGGAAAGPGRKRPATPIASTTSTDDSRLGLRQHHGRVSPTTSPIPAARPAQPVTGTQKQTCNDQVSYNYNAEQAAAARWNRRGSFSTSYSGSGSGSVGDPPGPARPGAKTNTAARRGFYDYKNYFSYSGGNWSMTSASGGTSGSGNTYQCANRLRALLQRETGGGST